jgi:hypothetical protein
VSKLGLQANVTRTRAVELMQEARATLEREMSTGKAHVRSAACAEICAAGQKSKGKKKKRAKSKGKKKKRAKAKEQDL